MKVMVKLRKTTTGVYETDVPNAIVQDGSNAVLDWLGSRKEQFPINQAVSVVTVDDFMLLENPIRTFEMYVAIPTNYLKQVDDETAEIFIDRNKTRFVTLFRSSIQDDAKTDDDYSNAEMLYITLRNDLYYTVKHSRNHGIDFESAAMTGIELMEALLDEGFHKIDL